MSRTFIGQVDAVNELDLPHTFKTGCPVDVRELVQLRFTHIDFDGVEASGTLVVNAMIADPLLSVLETAYLLRFPIAKAVPIDHHDYRGDDDLSMADNNSSSFNYRTIAGTNRVSMHSLGLAVDINPAMNPYLTARGIWQPHERHVDRTVLKPGMFCSDHPLVQAFNEYGFEWGGSWERPDYHHFEYITG